MASSNVNRVREALPAWNSLIHSLQHSPSVANSKTPFAASAESYLMRRMPIIAYSKAVYSSTSNTNRSELTKQL